MNQSPRHRRFLLVVPVALLSLAAASLPVAGGTPVEAPGQCSRLTSLVISEIMYRPPAVLRGGVPAKLEYVELFNSRGEPEDISGYRLAGNVEYTFPEGTVIPGGGFLVVARAPRDLEEVYGLTGVLGPWDGAATNGLPNDQGSIQLRHRAGAVFLDISYSSRPPWPVAPDGTGHTLVLARPSYGERDPFAWSASAWMGGSPGRVDPVPEDPLDGLVINEILAHTDPPLEDYLELYNHSNESKDLSGAWLGDSPVTNKFRIPNGTVLPPRGFISFAESTLGFALNSEGESVFLVNSNRTRVIDAVDFGPQENGVSFGRVPDGSPAIHRLAARTPGAWNGAALRSPIIINEVMYAPLSGLDDDQYVELYNRGDASVNLGGWRFTSGIDFTFPAGTVIPGRGYVVVAKNAVRLRAGHAHLTAANCVGSFRGNLSNNGERLALAKPHHDVVTNGMTVLTNVLYIDVNEVTYRSGGRWPQWADGGGSSMELTNPDADNRLASNWADSDETRKATWTTISATGLLDHGSTSSADQLQVLLQGAGECLIDEVEVLNSSGNNSVANGSFESGAGGWTAEGTQERSGLETTEGYRGSRSYHIRAVDRGDNQVNRIRTPLSPALSPGEANVTIRARVRWLKGTPGILLRLRGNFLECAADLPAPPNLGTPGAANSRLVGNAGPAISEVVHSPVLPALNEPIRVTARVSDGDGLSAVLLKYRLDPGASYATVAMTDDGAGGDALAGDGLYTGTIPGQGAPALIAFYIQAADAAGTTGRALFPGDAPVRECLARVGETQPSGDFPVYRLWLTQANLNAWNNRHKLNNTPLDMTFVLGNQRVIYNAQVLYAGSPYIAPGYCGPTCGRCGYSITLPPDDAFLNDQDLVLDWPGGHGGETTAIQEQMAYWIADRMDTAYSHRYTIRLHVNGVTDDTRRATFEAVMQPAGSFVRAWSPRHPRGDFFKVERAFEFSDTGGMIADPQPRLQDFTTVGGAKKREKYRWNWIYRSTDRMNDYTNIFALVDALNAPAPEPYTSAALGLVDLEQWMRIFALEHIIVNFDSWGHLIGKNMYAYFPEGGKWQLYMFDLDWLMLVSTRFSSGYGPSSAPLFISEDPTVSRMYAHPPFARAYWRAVQDAVNGPFDPAVCNPVMDAKYQSLLANGIAWCDGSALTPPTAVKTWFSQRRAFLQSQLATVAAPFSVGPAVLSNNLAVITGTAPVGVAEIRVNGLAWPVRWTSVTAWKATIPLVQGTNVFGLAGFDPKGRLVPGATGGTQVVYDAFPPSPVGNIVISEVMFDPLLPGAEYLELFNNSPTAALDLSGWRFHGLDYTFPPGAILGPNGYLVLAKDRVAFNMAYGSQALVFDVFPGNLQADGETLELVRPGADAASDLVVARLRYSPLAPWPDGAAGSGSSLQLVDSRQDNWRAGNWAVSRNDTPAPPKPRWTYFSVTGAASGTPRLYIYLNGPGQLHLDDLKLVAGNVPETGPNLAANGDFESPLSSGWTATANFAQSGASAVTHHDGNSSLQVVATAAGSGSGNAIYQDIPALANGQPYTLSFWYLQDTNASAPTLTVRLSGSGLSSGAIDPRPTPELSISATPGKPGGVAAILPAFPPLWINEVMAENLTGIPNGAGQRVPWIEIHNPSPNTVALGGLYLANNYTNLAQWSFPEGAFISPGEFKIVFADGQADLSTTNELHATFSLPARSGSVALSRRHNGELQVLDYLDYRDLAPDHSQGSIPDAQSFVQRELAYPTPGDANNGLSAPLSVLINEWMAANSATFPNPLTGNFDDWFELYNAGTTPADLAGYFLTDDPSNPFRFEIPGGFVIPPRATLLVWADGEAAANATGLHTNFRLNKSGSGLGLFGADGKVVDYVVFGPQVSDVSQGRYPDGASAIYDLPQATPGAPNVPASSPLLLRVLRFEAGRISVLINTSPAHRYQLEYLDSLTGGLWQALGEPVAGTGDAVTMTADTSSVTHRFYRVRRLP